MTKYRKYYNITNNPKTFMDKEKALNELEKIINQLNDDDFDKLRSSLDYLDKYIRCKKENKTSNNVKITHIEWYMGCHIYLSDDRYYVDMGKPISHSYKTLEEARKAIWYEKS